MSRRDVRPIILADLAVHGPSTWTQIAARTKIPVGTARNHLSGMARPVVGYVTQTEVAIQRYEWTITPTGRAFLASTEEETP